MSKEITIDIQVRARIKRGRYRTIGTMSVPVTKDTGGDDD